MMQTCKHHTLKLQTDKGVCTRDITDAVQQLLARGSGVVCIFTKHTTTGLRINEYEERLVDDMRLHLEQIAPSGAAYLHDDVHLRDCPPDEPINGHAHLKALHLNTSEYIPFQDGKLLLGKWQRLLLFDLDGGRSRELIVTVMT